MAATEDSGDEPAGEHASFRMSNLGWATVWPAVNDRLTATAASLEAVLDDRRRSEHAPSPADLALELGATATALFDVLAPEERDLRELVATLRTALALCWDMYSYPEASKVSVQSHMDRLRTEIDGFEAQLEMLQQNQDPDEGAG